MDRAEFIALQAQEVDKALRIDPQGIVDRASFEQLALETHDHMRAVDGPLGPYPIFEDTFDYLLRFVEQRSDPLPAALLQRWKDWRRDYPIFAADHPRLELLSLMGLLSQLVEQVGWWQTDEGLLQDWVDHNHLDPIVASNFDDWIAPIARARMRRLRQRIGGWLYQNEQHEIVFVPEPEWQRIRAARNAERAERERRDREWQDWKAARERRTAEVFALAKADKATWEALRARELERDAAARLLPKPQITWTAEEIGEKDAILQLDPMMRRYNVGMFRAWPAEEIEEKDAALPLDPVMRRFLDGVRRPGEALPVLDIVEALRWAVRRELGLDPHLYRFDAPPPTEGSTGFC